VFNGDPIALRNELDSAYKCADVRKIESKQSDTVSKAADPGKFKDEKNGPNGNQLSLTIFQPFRV
jgi:hypothetical protein